MYRSRRLLSNAFRVRRARRHFSAGANPARQLSLQPVAVGADERHRLKHFDATGRHGRLSDPGSSPGQAHAGRNVSERRAGPETCNAEADPLRKRGRLPPVGKRATHAPTGSAGVMLEWHAWKRGLDATREALSGGVARANRQPARVRACTGLDPVSGRQGGGEARSTCEAG